MNRLRRRINAAVNPASTAATRWWCHSALRRILTGYGRAPRRRLTPGDRTPVMPAGAPGNGTPSPEQMTEHMKARAKAVDYVVGRDH